MCLSYRLFCLFAQCRINTGLLMKRTNALDYRFYVLDIQRPWNVNTCINIILRKMKQTILFNLQIFWRFTN